MARRLSKAGTIGPSLPVEASEQQSRAFANPAPRRRRTREPRPLAQPDVGRLQDDAGGTRAMRSAHWPVVKAYKTAERIAKSFQAKHLPGKHDQKDHGRDLWAHWTTPEAKRAILEHGFKADSVGAVYTSKSPMGRTRVWARIKPKRMLVWNKDDPEVQAIEAEWKKRPKPETGDPRGVLYDLAREMGYDAIRLPTAHSKVEGGDWVVALDPGIIETRPEDQEDD